ncbi:hypothetical protein LJC32_03125 [Oscillospiraceae bacterium OttesenSCG-928-F05]|nr:hypothetical protein [Oscillospiraceae bacterium OttesenSCG-928-F05]
MTYWDPSGHVAVRKHYEDMGYGVAWTQGTVDRKPVKGSSFIKVIDGEYNTVLTLYEGQDYTIDNSGKAHFKNGPVEIVAPKGNDPVNSGGGSKGGGSGTKGSGSGSKGSSGGASQSVRGTYGMTPWDNFTITAKATSQVMIDGELFTHFTFQSNKAGTKRKTNGRPDINFRTKEEAEYFADKIGADYSSLNETLSLCQIVNDAGLADVLLWWLDSNGNVMIDIDSGKMNAPVKVSRYNSEIYINASFFYTEEQGEHYKNDHGRTLEDMISDVLPRVWGGYYAATAYDTFGGKGGVNVTVNVEVVDSQKIPHILVDYSRNEENPHVKSGAWDNAWKGEGAVEIFLRQYDSKESGAGKFNTMQVELSMAHEFGHILGLMEAYKHDNGPYKAPQSAEIPWWAVMRGLDAFGDADRSSLGRTVRASSNDIEMILYAALTGDRQYYTGADASAAIRYRPNEGLYR